MTGNVSLEEFAEMPVYKRVRYVRAQLGITQAALAAKIGVNERTIKGWEHPGQPRGAPDGANAEALAELSGYPASMFTALAPFEATIAEEISRKLDLLLAHFGPEARPISASEAKAALRRLELLGDGDGRSGRGEPQSGVGDQ